MVKVKLLVKEITERTKEVVVEMPVTEEYEVDELLNILEEDVTQGYDEFFWRLKRSKCEIIKNPDAETCISEIIVPHFDII